MATGRAKVGNFFVALADQCILCKHVSLRRPSARLPFMSRRRATVYSDSFQFRGYHLSTQLRNGGQVQTLTIKDECDKEVDKNDIDEKDDVKFFKALSKSANPYWISNAENMFKRLDWSRLLNPANRQKLEASFHQRQAKVDLDRILKLWTERQHCSNDEAKQKLTEELVSLALWVPNETHPDSMAIENDIPKEVFRHGEPKSGEAEEFSKVFLIICNY